MNPHTDIYGQSGIEQAHILRAAILAARRTFANALTDIPRNGVTPKFFDSELQFCYDAFDSVMVVFINELLTLIEEWDTDRKAESPDAA